MDFHALVNKLNQLDRAPIDQSTQEGCGDPMPSMPPPPPVDVKPDVPPPSMSVNLNAHGIDNIEDMMKLFVKVNPDMMPKADPMPTIAPPPTIMSITPELPPVAPMPDMDADNDDMPGGEKDSMMKMDLDTEPKDKKRESSDDDWEEGSLDQFVNTNDYNFEMEYNDDWDAAEEDFIAKVKREGHKITDINRDATPVVVAMAGDDFVAWYDLENMHGFIKPVDESWSNQPNPEEKDIDYMVNKLSGGMNKGHSTFPKVSDGDNPMQRVRSMEGEDLKAQIRDELRKRLAEAKGAK